MADLSLEWRGDFALTPAGDLVLSDGGVMTRQRILRRLQTAVRAYVWHQDYGAGLVQRIGKVARAADIEVICRAQIKLEASVAVVPIPTIAVSENESNPGLFQIAIYYTDAATGAPVALNFEVPTSR